MQEILTIQAEVETTNPIQIMDVCDAIIKRDGSFEGSGQQFR